MKVLKTKSIGLILASTLALMSCGSDEGSEVEDVVIPEVITINETALFPEGIDYNNNNDQFYVSSIFQGEVGAIDTETGAYTTFITDENFVNVVGILINEDSNRLFAVSGNSGLSGVEEPAVGSFAYLGIYDLETGSLIEGVDLGMLNTGMSGVFPNDIALDTDGNIYVTDSFSPYIYKVDGSTFDASIFVDGGDDFTASENEIGFGLNGIVYVNGNLVVGKTDSGTLIRVPLDEPTAFEVIDIDTTFVGLDGLEVNANGEIVIVRNGFAGDDAGLYNIASTDGWSSATVTSTPNSENIDATTFPTTATLAADGNIYALNSYFSSLIAGDNTTDVFSIVRQ